MNTNTPAIKSLESDGTHSVPHPGPTAGIVAVLCLGMLAANPGCTGFADGNDGWRVRCRQDGEPYPDYGELGEEICVAKNLPGGAHEEALMFACAQVINDYYPVNAPHDPAVFIGQIVENDGEKVGCVLDDADDYLEPVYELDPWGPSDNAVECHFLYDIVLTDNSVVTPSEDTLQPFRLCNDPAWDALAGHDKIQARQQACRDRCQALVDDLTGQGWSVISAYDCSLPNSVYPMSVYENACVADSMPGSILAASAELSFTDGINSVTQSGSGAMIYDDSACVRGAPCEPNLFMKLSLGAASFPFIVDQSTHVVSVTGITLAMLQPVQAVQDPASGLLYVDEIELAFSAETVSIDGIPTDPVSVRDYLGPIDVGFDPASGEITLFGGMDMLGGYLDVAITADPWSSTSWPD